MAQVPDTTAAEQPKVAAHGSLSPDRTTLVALAYLAIPNLIFVFGWFRWPVALLLTAILLWLFVRLPFRLRYLIQDASISRLVAAILIGFAWAAFSGGAHLMHADHDWVIRDAVLGELVRNNWPVAYAGDNSAPRLLRSAFGYFLPAAIFSKLVGTEFVHLAIYLWTGFGAAIFLLLLPLPHTRGRKLLACLLLVVFFSGMDVLGVILATGSLPIFPLRLEWWGPLSYPSLTGQLIWAPNHCLPAWIGIALLLRHRTDNNIIKLSALTLPVALIWSPFAPLALLPYAIIFFVQALHTRGISELSLADIFAGIVYAVPIGLFLTLDLASITMPSLSTAEPGFSAAQQVVTALDYALFVFCEFGVLALALILALQTRHCCKGIFVLSLTILLTLPFFRFGPSNDLLIRLSAPPLVVLLVCCLWLLQTHHRLTLGIGLVWITLIIGAATSFTELWRSVAFKRQEPDYHTPLAARQGGKIASHYAGRLDSEPLSRLLRPLIAEHQPAR